MLSVQPFSHLSVLFNINLLLCATVRVLQAQEKRKVRNAKERMFHAKYKLSIHEDVF